MNMTKTMTATAALILLVCGSALAQDETPAPAPAPQNNVSAALTLTLQSAGDIERTNETYQCSNGDVLTVQYINAAPNFLAIVPIEGEHHVFATTISGSGARYVSGPYEWWSHQGEGTLRDLMQDEEAEPMLSCTQASNTP
ncbi:MAG: MliC family protein [Devosia sp.]|jgi:membrane-bound inhibitor of C-type lysozyme|uniref:MliC family protein n=1 Tax=Devosia sp. TaxID=1871048 RepID=UPI0019EDC227|nr:MliC family protein [Devosia sp.]MBF0678896.1 MliC family protein [Devosia sp.]